jgi:hypothetical protein
MKTMVRPSRRAFFKPGPRLCGPLDNGGLIALPGTPGWFLRAPLAAAQQAPDARGTISDTKMAVNDHGNAPQGPEVIAKAMHTWALAEESA